MKKISEKMITIYEICYEGNGDQPLMMDPVFRNRRDAKSFAMAKDGCGLRYGAFVRGCHVTEAHAAKMLRLR